MSPDDHAELLRVRARVHKLETELPLLRLRVDAQFAKCERVAAAVDAMTEHDKVAAAFAEGMKAARVHFFSVPVKIGAALTGVAAVVGACIQVGRAFGWIG